MQTLTDLADALHGGVCRTGDHNPDLWTEDTTRNRAKALCLSCPVVTQCLDYATDPRTEVLTASGVWGGQFARRRNAMRNARVLNMGIDNRYQPVTIPAPRAASE